MRAQPHGPRTTIACRVTWRPSRWVIAALLAMGIAGAFAIGVSGLPEALQRPLAACAFLMGVLQALREHRRPPRVLLIRSDASATLDDMPLTHPCVQWRGSLAFVRARDPSGRMHRLAFWPDTLDAQGRRALRLAQPGDPTGGPLALSPRPMRG